MRIAICDDNQIDIDKERLSITEVLQEKKIAHEIQEYINPQDLINTNQEYDIVFLDIKMTETDGLNVAKAIHKKNRRCLIFFVTNYENYLDAAMDEYAFRFWVKPLNKQRLKMGIDSAVRRIEGYHKSIRIIVNRQKVSIDVSTIIYICAENKKTRIVTTKGEFVTTESFKSIKDKINSSFFYDSHASFYVNLNYVKAYTAESVICAYGQNEYRLHMSRRKYADFNRYFIDWMGQQL